MTVEESMGLFYDIYQKRKRKFCPFLSTPALSKKPALRRLRILHSHSPLFLKNATLDLALKIAISRIPSKTPDDKAQILLRDGVIWITTQEQASLPVLMQQKVIARFENRTFADVVQALSEQTGVSISLDQSERRRMAN